MKRFLLHATLALAVAAAAPALAAPGGGSAPPAAVQAPASAGVSPDGNAPRAALPDKYRWKLDALFSSDAAFEQGLQEAAEGRKRLATYRGRLSDPAQLAAALDEYFKTRHLTNRLTLYANLRFSTDQQSTELQAMNDRALAAMSDLMAVAGFMRQEVLALDDTVLARAYAEQPGIAQYKAWIGEVRRRRAHVLSPAEEKLLSAAGDNQFAEIDLNELPSGFEKTFQALLSDIPLPKITDELGKPVQLTLSNYGKYRSSADRRVRRETVEKFFQTLQTYRHAFAAAYAGQVNLTTFLARARGYDSALAAYLDRDNIDPQVYHNLIRSVRANLGPLHRYVRLRKQLMGLEEIRYYDLYPPMVKSAPVEVTYEEARAILPVALKPLGEKYLAVLTKGLDPAEGWVDVYPHKDKDSGASCSSLHGIHPFVKMNYYNESEDLSTLAHEFGHALHSHLSTATQPYASSNYASFIAEIASTANEKLLSDYLVAHAKTDEEKLYLLNEMVDRIRTTIYRQTLFAEFELRVHEAAEQGTPITAEFLDTTYRGLVRDYYGPDFAMGPDDGIEWAYIPHLYYKFYVFSYATGLSSGIALADLIQTKGEPAREAYLAMLAGGSSKPPLELLRGAGLDLTKPDAIDAAARLMDQTLTQMEQLVAKKQGGK